jgi:hypothetical protein
MQAIDRLKLLGGAVRSHRRAWPGTVLAAASLLVAGCGGGANVASISSTTSTTAASTGAIGASSPYTNALEYARCMRAHGEPGFPDPNNPAGFSTRALAALNTSSREFISADATCQRLLPNDGQPTPAELQQTITAGLRFSHCMRRHGVAFPDPGVSGGQLTLDLSVVNTNSPQYLAAAQICKTRPAT